MHLLVPSDPLRPRAPDPHFARDAAAARELGLPVSLLDHDALVDGRADEATARVPQAKDVVYRGWMVTSEQYASMAAALHERAVVLRTSADAFRRGHEFAGWYEALASYTPASVWAPGGAVDLAPALAAGLGEGRAILRDYVKSMKHYWEEACFVPDVLDGPAVTQTAHRFLELRDDSFTGGFVFRQFEDFDGAEVRSWWINGRCALSTAHPDTPDRPPPTTFSMPDLDAALLALALPFVTIDFARRADGVWRIVELGDGQVSDLPSSAEPALLLHALAEEFST